MGAERGFRIGEIEELGSQELYWETVLTRIRDGQALYFLPEVGNGDRMISQWSWWEMASRFAVERGVIKKGEEDRVMVRSLGEVDGFLLDWYNFNNYRTYRKLNRRARRCKHELKGSLLEKAAVFDQELARRDQLLVPLPLVDTEGPFVNYDKDWVLAQVGELRREFGSRKVVSLWQFGSNPLKRFTDEQMIFLGETVRSLNPEAVLVSVSDRYF